MGETFPPLEELERKSSVILGVFLPELDSFDIDFLIYRRQREINDTTPATPSVWGYISPPTDFIHLLK